MVCLFLNRVVECYDKSEQKKCSLTINKRQILEFHSLTWTLIKYGNTSGIYSVNGQHIK